MTTQTYRLKISRVNNLKLKTVARFPALVRVENFLTLTSENGVYTFGVDYSKLSPGPISDASTAYISIEDKTSGIFREVSLASLLTSGLDADLHAIAALTSNGILSRTADNTWALRTLTGTANEITVTNGSGVSGNPTVSLPAALTFTGKTVTGGTYQSPTISTPTGIVKGDVGLGNVDNTSDATKNAASATLTNKTISGASNTLTVREADLSTSDVTTADVSTTKHGFAPKLPNDSTKFLNGVGVYSTPAGSGVSVSGTPTANQMAQWTNSTTIQGANIASVLSAGIGISISGTTTATIAVNHSTLSNSLGSDVALNNTSNYFDGPGVAQGSTGIWFAFGTVTLGDSVGAANFSCKLWDGTTVADSALTTISSTASGITVALSGIFSNPAGNIRISCRDTTSTSGAIRFNSSGNSKDSTISVIRIG